MLSARLHRANEASLFDGLILYINHVCAHADNAHSGKLDSILLQIGSAVRLAPASLQDAR